MIMRGFINVCKPSGMTSSDVVVKVRGMLRRACGEKQKVGHIGTLDPLGTGVLPIAIGSATKLFDYFLDKTKVYIATFRFGVTTDTLDSAGSTILSGKYIPNREEIERTIKHFIGEYKQMPPQYSAKSVNGVRAYDLARKGVEVALTPKCVRINDITLLSEHERTLSPYLTDNALVYGEYGFAISCGGGTYIRSLARDIAKECGSVAYMSSIHRVQSGCFVIENSFSLEQIQENPLACISPIECALGEFERFELNVEYAHKLLNGVKIPYQGAPCKFAAYLDGEAVGILDTADGHLHMRTRL